MLIKPLVADRKQIIKSLAEHLGVKPEYQGAPTFKYLIGDYTIMKDGSIEVEDSKADLTLLRTLNTEGLIDSSWDEDREVLEIKLPYKGHTGKTLVNLTYLVASRAKLINKSIRCLDAFSINERFLEKLQEVGPETIENFMQVVEAVDANSINAGLCFEEDGISFCGFPVSTDSETVKAYMDLASLANKMALVQKRVQLDTSDDENEKYAFRGWLLRLGMKGDDYKATRKILLENLDGNAAFRTFEQAEAFREKHRVIKPEVTE